MTKDFHVGSAKIRESEILKYESMANEEVEAENRVGFLPCFGQKTIQNHHGAHLRRCDRTPPVLLEDIYLLQDGSPRRHCYTN